LNKGAGDLHDTEGNEPSSTNNTNTDNTTAEAFTNKELQQKRSKHIDMLFYWIQDCMDQNRFRIYWAKGENNQAN